MTVSPTAKEGLCLSTYTVMLWRAAGNLLCVRS